MSYKNVAIHAARLAKDNNMHPLNAWQVCVEQQYPLSESSQLKSCPKNTFLGLCEQGKVLGIPSKKYTRSTENKRYALKAVEILENSQNKKFDAK